MIRFSDFEKCYLCKQDGPCYRLPLDALNTHDEERFVRELHGKVREEWGLGPVFVTCCQAIFGVYFDYEMMKSRCAFLCRSEEIALDRINHVKSFILG